MSVLVDPVAAVTVMHQVSRLLLTVGVGLFLGYLVLIVAANIFGLVPRYVRKLTHGKQPSQPTVASEPAPSQRAQALIVAESGRKETRA